MRGLDEWASVPWEAHVYRLCSFIHTTKTTRILLCIKHPGNLKIFVDTDYISK